MNFKNILYNTGKYLIVEPFKFVTGYYLPRLQRLRKEVQEFENELKNLDAELEARDVTSKFIDSKTKDEKEKRKHLENLSLKGDSN